MKYDASIPVATNGRRPTSKHLILCILSALLAVPVPVATAQTGTCESGVCAIDAPCGLGYRFGSFWFRGDVLLWWTNRAGNAALVTTSPAETPPELAGRLDQDTTVLLAAQDLNPGVAAGGRFTVGWWFDDLATAGLQASYLRVGSATSRFRAASPNPPILARPFTDAVTGAQDALLIAHPEFLAGAIDVDLDARLQGFQMAWRLSLLRGCSYRTDFLVGYRWLEFDERLQINSSAEFVEPRGQIIVGSTQQHFDLFDVSNRFHGAELGLVHQHHWGCLTAEISARVALGGTTGEVEIDGRTINTVPEIGSFTYAGGLLAQPTNMGWYQVSQFAAVPEFGVHLAYNVTPSLSLMCGYHLIVWPRVVRAADQLDVNLSQLPPEPPGPGRLPRFPASQSTFVAQGLQLGLQLVW